MDFPWHHEHFIDIHDFTFYLSAPELYQKSILDCTGRVERLDTYQRHILLFTKLSLCLLKTNNNISDYYFPHDFSKCLC